MTRLRGRLRWWSWAAAVVAPALLLGGACSKHRRTGGAGSGGASADAGAHEVVLRSCARAPLRQVGFGLGTGGLGGIGIVGTTTAGGRIGGRGFGGVQRGPGAAEVNIGMPTVSAGLERDMVRRILRRAGARLEDCLRQPLATSPDTGSLASVRYAIGASGQAKGVVVEGVADQKLTRCLSGALADLAYPRPSTSSVEVTLELKLFPTGRPRPDAGLPVDVAPWLRDQATPVLGAAAPGLAGCLREARRRVPGLAGTLLTSVLVGDTGAVQQQAVGGVGDSGLEECAGAVLGKLALPAPPREVAIDCSYDLGDAAAFRVTTEANPRAFRLSPGRMLPDRVVARPGHATLIAVAPETDGGTLIDALSHFERPIAWAVDRGEAQPPEVISSFPSLHRLDAVGAEPGSDPIEIWVRGGEVIIGSGDAAPVTVGEPGQLAAALRALVAARPALAGRRDVSIALDEAATFQQLAEVMRQAIAAGLPEIEVVGVMQLRIAISVNGVISG